MLPRNFAENVDAINNNDLNQEKISLSDRFGIWLGFHNCSQDEYLDMVYNYDQSYDLKISKQELKTKSIEWAATRGSRSGRVAKQFINDIAGKLEINIY